MNKELKPGSKAIVAKGHPHAGKQVTLISYGPYGLAFMQAVGWLVKDGSGLDFYCKTHELK